MIKKSYKIQDLKKFINSIDNEKEFISSKNLNSKPWIYLEDKNINFLFYYRNNLIIAVLVILKNKYVNHIIFLYILKSYRCKKIGSMFIKYVKKEYSDKHITVHVYNSLFNSIKFYNINHNFKIYKNITPYNGINCWRNKNIIKDKNFYNDKQLLYYIKS